MLCCKVLTTLSFIASLSLISGCATNPVTGKSDFSLVSADQELAIGAQHYDSNKQAQGGVYLVDPELNVYVASVGRKLAAVSDRAKLPYEFVVLDNDVPNAWALPGGKIAINRGLLYLLEDEAQLAAVLSHEIVHAAARHSAQQMSQQMLLGTGLQVLAIASQSTGYGELASGGAQLGVAAWGAHYSRDNELEADYYGMKYMALAGYEPQGAVELQQAFVKLSQGQQQDAIGQLFASHPPSPARVSANRKMAATLPAGQRNIAQYQRATAQVFRDKAAYELHNKAIEAAVAKDYNKALGFVEQALKTQPKAGQFWLTKARLLEQKGDKGTTAAFDKAVAANPEYYAPLLYRGAFYMKAKKLDQARQDLSRSEAMLSTQQASFYLAEIHLQKGENQQALARYQQLAQAGGEIGQMSQQRIAQLTPAQ